MFWSIGPVLFGFGLNSFLLLLFSFFDLDARLHHRHFHHDQFVLSVPVQLIEIGHHTATATLVLTPPSDPTTERAAVRFSVIHTGAFYCWMSLWLQINKRCPTNTLPYHRGRPIFTPLTHERSTHERSTHGYWTTIFPTHFALRLITFYLLHLLFCS